MARTLCPDRERASIAVVTALIILFSASSIAQIGGILLGGIAGLWLCRGSPPTATGHIMMPVSRTASMAALTAFFVLLIAAAEDQRARAVEGVEKRNARRDSKTLQDGQARAPSQFEKLLFSRVVHHRYPQYVSFTSKFHHLIKRKTLTFHFQAPFT